MNLLTRIGKFLRLTLTTIQSKRQCSLSCHVNWNTDKLSVAYVSFPVLVATYSKLQMTKTTSFVQVYNTCIPHEPAMGKHEYTTSVGKFVVPMSTICGYLWPNLCSLVLF